MTQQERMFEKFSLSIFHTHFNNTQNTILTHDLHKRRRTPVEYHEYHAARACDNGECQEKINISIGRVGHYRLPRLQ